MFLTPFFVQSRRNCFKVQKLCKMAYYSIYRIRAGYSGFPVHNKNFKGFTLIVVFVFPVHNNILRIYLNSPVLLNARWRLFVVFQGQNSIFYFIRRKKSYSKLDVRFFYVFDSFFVQS